METKTLNKEKLSKILYFVFVITFLDFLLEVFYGFYFNSLALLSDSVYMFMDLSGQAMAVVAIWISKLPPDHKRTFGYHRVEIISALLNGLTAGIFLVMIFFGAIKRIFHPEQVNAEGVFWISILGLAVNLVGIFALYSGSKKSLNIAGAFLRVLMDGLSSVGVIISSILIQLTHNYIFDPLMSILVGLTVVYPIYDVIKKSVNVLLEGVPETVNIEELKRFIEENFPELVVKSVHAWQITPEKTIMYARIRNEPNSQTNLAELRDRIKYIKNALKERFGFESVVIEIY